ncbi:MULTISPECIES: hypothetical protein [unclassified Roseovarius]|uniref:hypothetical protein n=1 Tax=unclassified Roseovarius TaxID=2614913 RepID=UPI00273CFEFE|nr:MULTISPECIES: hypothetical protein [unclassified Roseovarius]
MRHFFKKLLPSLALALTATGFLLPMPARAQTYPIDCAILLCLSGGWPASVPCARARAEFIRRITPWPVEPPLQIWRCPMGASYETDRRPNSAARTFDVFFGPDGHRKLQFLPASDLDLSAELARVAQHSPHITTDPFPTDDALWFVQGRADIDVSGPEFDFVRSIRVFDIRLASQRLVGEQEQCRRYASVFLGTYGNQGEFSWQTSSPSAVPEEHIGLKGWGDHCPAVQNRSVFVDWLDFQGNYGFEQVDY